MDLDLDLATLTNVDVRTRCLALIWGGSRLLRSIVRSRQGMIKEYRDAKVDVVRHSV